MKLFPMIRQGPILFRLILLFLATGMALLIFLGPPKILNAALAIPPLVLVGVTLGFIWIVWNLQALPDKAPLTRRQRWLRISPLLTTLALVVWTACVAPISQYGDSWAVYPAVPAFPVALLFHIWIIVSEKSKLLWTAYAIGHLVFLFFIEIGALFLLSKDSL